MSGEGPKLAPALHAQLANLGLVPPAQGTSSVIGTPQPPGDLIFGGGSMPEHLCFKPDGTILVHGRVAGSDRDVVDALRGWAGMLPNSPIKIAIRALDRRSFRTTVWDSPLWERTKHGPCGIVGDMSDVMDERLMAIRLQIEFFAHEDDRRAAFEERALEVDTACAKWNRSVVCDYTRSSLEVEYGRDWRRREWTVCARCEQKHPGAVA